MAILHRPRVAYLASADTLPGARNRRGDAWEHDLTIGLIGMGLHGIDRSIEPVRWNDGAVDWQQFECAVIGTTWDYTEQPAAFLHTLARVQTQTRVLNSPKVVAWNAQKTYLQALATQACAAIPTVWLDAATEPACRAALAQFNSQQLVIKPQIGAGAWRQVKWQADQPWPSADELPLGAAMVQPFLPSVATEGEYSLLFFNGEFSHAVLKRPRAGDYRVQSSYGGTDVPYLPTRAETALARTVLEAVGEPLLYARVDMVRGDGGGLLLMELELIEPYLYPVHAPQMGEIFARAYRALVGV
jgi:glutathione synthase/RimK-type ligase-like ATP-grasp enzyme